MTTAQTYIDTILRYTGELTDFSIATPDARNRALNKLNEYIELLRDKGCTLNSSQTEITDEQQNVNYPSYAQSCIELNTAQLLWGITNPSVPYPHKKDAKKTQAYIMYKHGPSLGQRFPGTLPRGNANRDRGYGNSTVLYPDYDPPMYTDEDGNLQTSTGENIVTQE